MERSGSGSHGLWGPQDGGPSPFARCVPLPCNQLHPATKPSRRPTCKICACKSLSRAQPSQTGTRGTRRPARPAGRATGRAGAQRPATISRQGRCQLPSPHCRFRRSQPPPAPAPTHLQQLHQLRRQLGRQLRRRRCRLLGQEGGLLPWHQACVAADLQGAAGGEGLGCSAGLGGQAWPPVQRSAAARHPLAPHPQASPTWRSRSRTSSTAV